MAYEVFISYSTNDLPVVEHIRKTIESPSVKTFVAEYSVSPGSRLAPSIIDAIKKCDLFVLIWSKNSKISEWVPQEIGVAKGDNKTILPLLLQKDLHLPGLIKDLKYLPAYDAPEKWLPNFRNEISSKAEKQELIKIGIILCIGLAALWFLGRGK